MITQLYDKNNDIYKKRSSRNQMVKGILTNRVLYIKFAEDHIRTEFLFITSIKIFKAEYLIWTYLRF